MLLTILVILLVLALVGGFGYDSGRYRTHGLGLGGTLLIILLVLWLLGAFR